MAGGHKKQESALRVPAPTRAYREGEGACLEAKNSGWRHAASGILNTDGAMVELET